MAKRELAKSESHKELALGIQNRIDSFVQNGELSLPEGYSPQNALKSAFLVLQETVDRSKKPVLESCTKVSISNALLDMIIQGLNPSKDQCYFIAYGSKLICQRSYFGSMSLVKSLCGAKDVYANCVHKEDDFEYKIEQGKVEIKLHSQTVESLDSEILAAYAVIEFEDRKHIELMTMKQIKAAWSQGQIYNEGKESTHTKFSSEMCKKTVINRACKNYINSSVDSGLIINSINRSAVDTEEGKLEKGLEDANTEVLDMPEDTDEFSKVDFSDLGKQSQGQFNLDN